jgi:ubiquitin related modifier 1
MYSGGLEMLFDNKHKHNLSIPTKDVDGSPASVKFLANCLCDKIMGDSRKELFVVDGTVY